MSKTCLALIADGSEEIEIIGPVDILRRSGFTVTLAGISGSDRVRLDKGCVLCPDIGLSECMGKNFDIVLVPGGGGGMDNMMKSDLVGDVLKKQNSAGGWIAAICGGPVVLKSFGIGFNKKITSSPKVKDHLTDNYQWSEDSTLVDGKLITSHGPGTAIEFALVIIRELMGDSARAKVAAEVMHYYN